MSFTSDGVAVLLHDATIDRTSDGTDTETLFMPIERVAIGHDGSILATGGITFDTIDPSNGNNTGIFYRYMLY